MPRNLKPLLQVKSNKNKVTGGAAWVDAIKSIGSTAIGALGSLIPKAVSYLTEPGHTYSISEIPPAKEGDPIKFASKTESTDSPLASFGKLAANIAATALPTYLIQAQQLKGQQDLLQRQTDLSEQAAQRAIQRQREEQERLESRMTAFGDTGQVQQQATSFASLMASRYPAAFANSPNLQQQILQQVLGVLAAPSDPGDPMAVQKTLGEIEFNLSRMASVYGQKETDTGQRSLTQRQVDLRGMQPAPMQRTTLSPFKIKTKDPFSEARKNPAHPRYGSGICAPLYYK